MRKGICPVTTGNKDCKKEKRRNRKLKDKNVLGSFLAKKGFFAVFVPTVLVLALLTGCGGTGQEKNAKDENTGVETDASVQTDGEDAKNGSEKEISGDTEETVMENSENGDASGNEVLKNESAKMTEPEGTDSETSSADPGTGTGNNPEDENTNNQKTPSSDEVGENTADISITPDGGETSDDGEEYVNPEMVVECEKFSVTCPEGWLSYPVYEETDAGGTALSADKIRLLADVREGMNVSSCANIDITFSDDPVIPGDSVKSVVETDRGEWTLYTTDDNYFIAIKPVTGHEGCYWTVSGSPDNEASSYEASEKDKDFILVLNSIYMTEEQFAAEAVAAETAEQKAAGENAGIQDIPEASYTIEQASGF